MMYFVPAVTVSPACQISMIEQNEAAHFVTNPGDDGIRTRGWLVPARKEHRIAARKLRAVVLDRS